MQKETPSSGFILQDLEFMYLEYHSQYGIQLESHVTRFGDNLTPFAPNLETRKVVNNKLHVFVSSSVTDIVDQYLQTSLDWIQRLRAIIQPIRNDIFARKNSFGAH